jgi:hypothetical protein
MLPKGFNERLALVVGLASITLALAAGPAGAAGRGPNDGARHPQASGAQHAPRGDYTRHTERARTENGHTRHDEITNGAGKTATRDASVVNDRVAGTRTRDVVATGPNGKTATRQNVTQRTDNGYTRDSIATGPNGKTATRNATVARDKEAGTLSRDVVATGPNGGTRTLDDNVQRTEDGFTRSTIVTNPNGSSATRDVTASYDAATKTVTKDVSVDRTPAPQPAP